MTRGRSFPSLMAATLFASACGGAPPSETTQAVTTMTSQTETQSAAAQPRTAPESGPARDVNFPPIERSTLANGLELNTVTAGALPVVYLRLVIKSGGASDPRQQPGLAHLVSLMLNEGTKTRSAAKLADDVEFLGADLGIGSDEETLVISMRALKDQLPQAMEILADVALNPAFAEAELTKLKRRELDRIQLRSNDPGFLASREFYRALYGAHPYANIDTTAAVVERVRKNDLVGWHRKHFLPNNAFIVAVGDVTSAQVADQATRVFSRWRRGRVEEPTYGEIPARTAREIVLVDRPESVQSVFAIGNMAISRESNEWIPLAVANQVLGGSAASRLFMDLREQRSLTYGAYSRIDEAAQPAPFRASASVRNEVTAEATSAFVEHLERIVREPAPAAELLDAQRYLSDSFPLRIETAGRIADMVADLRVYGLPDDYWDTYRTQIRAVTPEAALAAAQANIRPDRALFVVVGRASAVLEPLRHYGPVRVVAIDGTELSRHEKLD
jgi:zinc protease